MIEFQPCTHFFVRASKIGKKAHTSAAVEYHATNTTKNHSHIHVPPIKFNCSERNETTCDVTMVSTVNFLVVRYSAVRDFVESAHVAQVAKRANLSAG